MKQMLPVFWVGLGSVVSRVTVLFGDSRPLVSMDAMVITDTETNKSAHKMKIMIKIIRYVLN